MPLSLVFGCLLSNLVFADCRVDVKSVVDAEKKSLDEAFEKEAEVFRELRAEVVEREKNNQEQWEHFQHEVEAARAMRGDLIEVLKPMLPLLFPSLGKEGDIWAQVGRFLPEGSAAVRCLSEVTSISSTGHALAVVKSHYPWV
uniref:Uncharacterized protein n=1 Tax=Oryza punctata TaxID=4537 RepID=A0A0E0LA67_ORYPU